MLWLGQNCHRLVEGLLASAKLGAVFAPANWRQSPEEFVTLLDDARAKVVIWQDEEIGAQVSEARRLWAGEARWLQHDGTGTDVDGDERATRPSWPRGPPRTPASPSTRTPR